MSFAGTSDNGVGGKGAGLQCASHWFHFHPLNYPSGLFIFGRGQAMLCCNASEARSSWAFGASCGILYCRWGGVLKVKAKRNQVSWWEWVLNIPHVYYQYRICRLPCKNCAQKGLESSTWKPCWGKVNRAYMLALLTPSKRKTCHGCVADGDTPQKQPKDLVWGLVFPLIFLMPSRNIHTDTNIDRSLLGWLT